VDTEVITGSTSTATADVDSASGEVENTDPNLSLGGVMTTEVVVGQSAVFAGGGITGVTPVRANGHDPANLGEGILQFAFAGTTLSWTPLTGSVGVAIDVSVDGRYVIAGSIASQYILVDVVSASLPGGDTSDNVIIASVSNALYDDVNSTESSGGHIDYRCFYVHNINTSDPINNVQVFIESQPTGLDSIEIGLDPAGIGDGVATGVAVIIGDELTAPAGVSFSSPPDLLSALLIGNLPFGEGQAVWIKRTTPINTLFGQIDDRSRIQFEIGFPP
jgi:hypothetical protein